MENPKVLISKILRTLPNKPGIYKMVDKEGTVIYVGKAKDLKKRVSQYFQKSKTLSTRTKKLIENIADIKYTVVDSELEALILELNLIKELHPKYNVLLKDDKNYVYIKITNDEDFPRVQIVRKIDDKTSTYYGPKTAKHKVEKTFKTLKKVLPFRHCNLDIETISGNKVAITRKTIKYPCLDHYIKRCCAPCISNCTKEEYAEIIRNVKRFFEGHHEEIISSLKVKMANLAQGRKFEEAARLRDRIKNVEDILERQKISDPNRKDTDIFNYVLENNKAFFNLFQIRDGKLINQENFILQAQAIEDTDESAKEELLGSFLTQYYEKTTNLPKEILIPHDPADKKYLKTFVTTITTPQKGEKNKLLNLSQTNAKIFADRNRVNWQEEGEDKETILKNVKKLLELKTEPKRIECYDISHLSGTDTVGSMIVFENGVPAKDMYRKFKIKSVIDKPDDYKSLEEVLTRRFSHIATDLLAKDFKFKKSKATKDAKDGKQLFYLEAKNKKIAGTITLHEINQNMARLSELFVNEKYRGKKLGHKLIQETILKSKSKRFYIACKKELVSYYEQLGFEEIKVVPKELEGECLKCQDISGETVWYAADKIIFKKDPSFSKTPDLIIIDGGKGQLSISLQTLKKLKIDLPIISIAKKEELLFTPKNTSPIKLEPTNPALKLIQSSRDEAHRFAISYNKTLRRKRVIPAK